jgi:hypothetical protein
VPLLFTYGSLQRPEVQLATFGRHLAGGADDLPQYHLARVPIDDPRVIEEFGEPHFNNAQFDGAETSRLAGMAFEMTDAEIAQADGYEARYSYVRVLARLASGRTAWVYVHQPRD